MDVSRADKFKAAMRQREQEKIEEQEKRNRSFQYDPIDYCALKIRVPKIIRIFGLPYHVREDEFSPKIINISMIAGDNDKPFRCIWPLKEVQPDWILWRIFDRVLEYDWDSSTNTKIFRNQEKHPAIFTRVFKNNKPHIAYEKGWKPSTNVVMNVIDRAQMDWHKENQSTLVLSKRVSESKKANGEVALFYDAGVPKMLYDMILDDIVEHYGDWTTYDIAITKLDDKPWYKVAYLLNRKEEFSNDLIELMVDGPLTEEEKLYKQFDLDKLFQVTSYQKIKNRLKAFIQQVDSAFNTTYYEELCELAEKEKEERGKKQVDDAAEFFEEEAKKEKEEKIVDEKTKIEVETSEKKVKENDENPPMEEKKTRARRVPKSIDLDSFGYTGVIKLTEDEKKLIVGANESGAFIYGNDEQLYSCPTCEFEAPGSFHCCPKCGEEFE